VTIGFPRWWRQRGEWLARLAAVAVLSAILAACQSAVAGPGGAPGATQPMATARQTPAVASPSGRSLSSAGILAPPGRSPTMSPSPSGVSAPAGSLASPSPGGPVPEGGLPRSQSGFQFRGTVVPMTFPLPLTSTYHYGHDFLVPRDGVTRWFDHVRGMGPTGALLRAHDGIDVFVPIGTAVVAPFRGRVIDPAGRWNPWDVGRYGLTVVIVSSEPGSLGYTAILAHLSKVNVRPGDAVTRGQVVGRTGRTGNAAGTPSHLHFELRTPFLLTIHEGGLVRRLDAFDPWPSLRAADPRAR